MRKTLIQILCLLILTPIVAKASTIDLPATGQAISQAVGDDGAVQAGKAWPTPRFVDNRNGTVSDNLTGLVWSGDANLLSSSTSGTNGAIIWQKALDEIKRLNASAYLGYSDWRLPNLNELASLLHQGEPVQSVWLSRNGFFNTAAVNYWSSSSFTRDASRVWTVQMNGGSVATLPKSGTALVWLVRGASNLLPATGQVACYNTAGLTVECTDTGQDGELRMGAAWPAFRFADNGNGTITDNLTGLIWPKNANPTMDAQISRASGGSVLWADALEFVTGLNGTSYLGFSDWRLPNHNELVSLVNYAETTPGVQLNRAGVRDIREQYWSSSSSIANPSDAWNVTMNGEVAELNKFDARLGSYIWPVRGGIETQAVSLQSGETQSKTLVKAVAAAAVTLSVTTSSLSAGTVGTAYSRTLAATGGTTPYTWTKKTGSLPAGVTLSTAGIISGTPTTAATSTFTVQVKDKAAKTATKSLSITINAAPLSITTATLADGYLTTAYSKTLTASGGKTAYSWSITSGSLPAGLALAASTGKISGTPTATGSTAITVQVKDANATIVSKSLILTVYALPSISTATLSAGNVGTVYSQALTATGGKTAYSWSISSGTLPAGLTLAASTGVVSGTPTTAVTSSVTFKVIDANARTATKALTITVSTTPPAITSTTLADGYAGASYSQALTVTGGKSPYAWTKTAGTLPAGLVLSTAGVISGTPTAAGSNSFTVQVKDANNSISSISLYLNINLPLIISTTVLHDSFAGIDFRHALSATNGLPPYAWSISGGSMPVGLSLDALTGIIGGTPTTSGTSDFTVQVKDSVNTVSSKTFSINITGFGSVSGVVTELSTGVPMPNVNVTLNMSEITTKNPGDLLYSCYDSPIASQEYSKLSTNDDVKIGCYGHFNTYFKVRNPYGAKDPFTFRWNGLSAYSGSEYLAQSFKPIKTGSLNRVSFYFSGYQNIWVPSQGNVYVLLKSSLGGDRGVYLAHSERFAINHEAPGGWVDFDFISPVPVTAGQEYFLELQGHFPSWEYVSGNVYYDSTLWGNDVQYADGVSYQRNGGNWQQLNNSLAFQTYVDNALDIVTSSPTQSVGIHGSGSYAPHVVLSNISNGGGELCAIDIANYNGFNTDYNSGDYSCTNTVTNGRDYYDQNGWITVLLYNSLDEFSSNELVTDQISLTFNRTLTAITDANGLYSFPNLPDGNYSIKYEKPAYNLQTTTGVMALGQLINLNSTLTIAPPATIIGAVRNNYTTGLISGATITVTDVLGVVRSATSNELGQYSIANLAVGPYSITFEHPEYQKKADTGSVTSGQSASLTAYLYPNPPVLTIASPVSGATLDGSPLVVTGTVSSDATSVTVNGYTASIVNGVYSVTIPHSYGNYTITVTAGNQNKGTVTQSINVTFVVSGTISGLISDALTMHPLAAVQVAATYNSSGKGVKTVSDSAGRYSLNNLYDDEIYVSIEKPGYRYYETTLTIVNGQARILNASLSPILPVITAVSVTTPSEGRAVITWTTDQQTTSTVDYGSTVAYGNTQADANISTTHAISLASLSSGATYHYRLSSTNAYGITATSGDLTFRTLPFNVRSVADSGNVALMETTGTYDAKNPDGTVNDTPRQEIAKEYIRTHGDAFDFLVFLSTFDYTLPEAGAEGFYLPIKNDIQGINQPIFDNSAQFGSVGKLQGTVDLGNITQLATNPYGPLLDTNVRTLSHELMHRFGAYVRFKNQDGTLNTDLLGKDSAHWSYLLDSKGSIMYGNGWKDNKDGTFTSTAIRNAFSPLDLYLMGMIPKEQVPPMVLIDNPAIDKTKLPQLGATISGTAKTITIDDIVAAEGERIPNAATAQKQFNVGFVLLTRAGDNATAATQAVETLRKVWAGRFAEQTNGIGGISGVTPSVSLVVDSPSDGATITGPDVTVSGTVINSSGAETGVTVNGMPATVTGSRFIVNHVPLQLGANTISISATDANGLTATTTKSVTAQAGNYIRITSNIESGTGPLDVSLRLEGSFSVDSPTLTTSGPATVTLVQGESLTDFAAKLIAEGAYIITASAVGPDGQTYTDSVTVTVISRTKLENLLKAKWDGMKQKIAAGDIQGAGAYFPEATRYRFQAIFNDPAFNIMSRLNEISAIKIYTIMDGSAQGGAIRQEDDGVYAYPINYTRDENGIWRIYGF